MLARFTMTPRFPGLWREFDELVRDFTPTPPPTRQPSVDILETDKAIELHVDLPGVTPEQIDVKVEGDQLTITAERRDERTTEQKGWVRKERSFGQFSRSFTLPPTLDGTKPEASYRHGVLTVTLPKREEAQPRSLKVKVEA